MSARPGHLVRFESGALASELAAHGATGRPLAMILGSGLGSIAERLVGSRVIPAERLEHLPRPSVQGHTGGIVLGDLAGVPTIVQRGRVHLYEGGSVFGVVRSIRAFALLGVEAIVLTNASGGLDPDLRPGTWMRITDHLNLQGHSPLLAEEPRRASPYDETLGAILDDAALAARVPFARGVYAAMPGPAYETPAEVRALRALGARAVGMSTACEASAAYASGMRVVALACIANHAAGLSPGSLQHGDVLSLMRRAAGGLGLVLERSAPKLVGG
jgi:purine-nucleoside phosphorylase